MSLIGNKLQELNIHQERALICFLMAGFPNREGCLDCIKAVEQGGADIIELGVPYSDPLADGETIERLHHYGVGKGWNLPNSLKFTEEINNICTVPLILFSYYNPLFKMGLDQVENTCRARRIGSLVIPDLPLDQLIQLKTKGLGMDIIPMVAPSSNTERLQMVNRIDASFVYCVSVKGTTGVRRLPLEKTTAYLQRVREEVHLPLALGFGISGPEIIDCFYDVAEAFVVGSLLAKIIEDNKSDPTFMYRELEKTVKALKKATRGEV